MKAAGQVPFTQLHHLEVRNAFELLVGRTLITRDECRGILGQLQEDFDIERLMTLAVAKASGLEVVDIKPRRRRKTI